MDEVKSDTIDQGPTSPSSDSSNDVVILPHPASSITSPVTPFTPSNGNLSVSSLTPTTPSSTNPKKRKRLTVAEREERDRERQEKRLKLEQEKIKKDEEKRKKDEEKAKREEERLKKIEENKKKEEERLLKKHQLEEEKRIKKEQLEEEKRIKKEQLEQEKQKREDEKRKKQEEIDKKNREKEAEKKKEEKNLAKQANFLANFLHKSPSTNKGPKKIVPTKIGDLDNTSALDTSFGKSENSNDSNKSSNSNIDPSLLFRPIPFQIKKDMAVAPRIRRVLTPAERKKLDQYGFCSSNASSSKENKDPITSESTTTTNNSHEQEELMEIDDNNSHGSTTSSSVPNTKEINNSNYLSGLKQRRGRKSGRTETPVTDPEKDDPEVSIIDDQVMENPRDQGLVKWRYKLLQFHDNQRPAYWGTWKKPPLRVKGKNPTKQEPDIDYEYDSDDDWEVEPEDGEDLGNSDKEDEAENGDSEDEDDGWLVPHGYISDDEGAQDEHFDKEALKLKEKNYFDDLNKQIKVNLPFIQTHGFSSYKMIFSPAMKKWKEMSSAFKAFNPIPSTSTSATVFTSPSTSQKVCNTSISIAN